MMLRSPFAKLLWDGRWSIFAWSLAISLVGGFYAVLWSTINDAAFQNAIDSYPESLLEALNYDDISTPAGYLTASVYGLIVAILILVQSVSAGARTIAGAEEAGTLELIVAHPISRKRLALERFLSLLTSAIVISTVFWVVMLLIRSPAGLEEVSVMGFLAMHVQLVLFAGFYGAITFAVGAATGRRAFALGAGAAAGVVGYLAYGLIPQVDGLEWVQDLSPFEWLTGGDPLNNGLQLGDSILMVGLGAGLVAVGIWAFDRRDIGV